MTLITREALTTPIQIPMERVEIPELGGHLNVKGMTAGERTRFESVFQGKGGKQRNIETLRQRLLIQTVCDDDGNRILQPDDIASLGQQSAVIIERLVNVAMRLCGMSDSDVESMVGNSSGTTGDE